MDQRIFPEHWHLVFPSMLSFTRKASAFFCLFSIPVLYSALVAANQRVRWDKTGFWYRTAFHREIRYDFSDVRQIRPVNQIRPVRQIRLVEMGRIGSDLFVNVNGRRFLLDETTLWEGFASAYANWQTRNNHPS